MPNGFGLIMIGAGVIDPEIEFGNSTWPAPLFVGLDLSDGLQYVPILTDGNGEFQTTTTNPGLGDLMLGIQVQVAPTASGPFYGTSNPLTLILE